MGRFCTEHHSEPDWCKYSWLLIEEQIKDKKSGPFCLQEAESRSNKKVSVLAEMSNGIQEDFEDASDASDEEDILGEDELYADESPEEDESEEDEEESCGLGNPGGRPARLEWDNDM